MIARMDHFVRNIGFAICCISTHQGFCVCEAWLAVSVYFVSKSSNK